jgi:hypothetical protein
MKKLLLLALAVSGFAGVAALRSDAQTMTTVLVPRTEGLSFGFPSGYLWVLWTPVCPLLSACWEIRTHITPIYRYSGHRTYHRQSRHHDHRSR